MLRHYFYGRLEVLLLLDSGVVYSQHWEDYRMNRTMDMR